MSVVAIRPAVQTVTAALVGHMAVVAVHMAAAVVTATDMALVCTVVPAPAAATERQMPDAVPDKSHMAAVADPNSV